MSAKDSNNISHSSTAAGNDGATATKSDSADNMARIRELGNAPVGRLLWKYSLPAVVGTVVSAIYNIVDSIVIGHAINDPNVVAGIAVTFPVMNIIVALGMLIGAGAATRVSIVMGQNDKRVAEIILGNCVQLTLIIGVVYAAIFGIFIEPILKAFGALCEGVYALGASGMRAAKSHLLI